MTAKRPATRHPRPKAYPFGTPDGARANIKEIMDGFVGIGNGADLGDPAEDLTPRLIVGRLGSGKTVYLRRSQAFAASDPATYADDVRSDQPSTQDVVRMSEQYQRHLVSETWAAIWHKALLRALSSHLLFAPQLNGALTFDERECLTKDYPSLLGQPTTPRSPYAEVGTIINKHQSQAPLDRYLRDDRWHDIATHLAAALRKSKPVYLYVDAIDDQFEIAPMAWLKFQKGMFFTIMSLLREPGFGGRLHVVACVRDIVFSDVLCSEHAGRYRDEPHIRVLNWDAEAIGELLDAKIADLGSAHRMNPDVHGVAGWLGTTHVDNPARGVVEPVDDYILRHTWLRPRDLVEIGNALSREVAAAKSRGASALAPETIRRVVDGCSAAFANVQLEACANQIAADVMPSNAVAEGYSEVYLGDTDYSRGIVEILRQVLLSVETDRFDGLALNRAREEATARLSEQVSPDGAHDRGLHVLDVLWQHGLLGYETRDNGVVEVRFSATLGANDFHLPLDRRGYALHPCVAHTVPVRSVGLPIMGACLQRRRREG